MYAEGRRSGFTLAEVLLALTASVLLVGGVLSTFILFSRLYRDGSEQLAIHSRARYGIERVAAGVSGAEGLTVQAGGNELRITVPATTLRSAVNSTHSTLHIEDSAALPSNGVVWVDEEAIAYGGKDSKNLLSCTRGYSGTTATKHDNREIVYIHFAYYLDGTALYYNANGNPSPASDEQIVWAVEKNEGTDLFQLISPGSGSFRSQRIIFSFKCFEDKNKNHRRETDEPGLDVAFEVFARNT